MSEFSATAGVASATRRNLHALLRRERSVPLRLFDSVESATSFWDILDEHAVTSPFQRRDWVAAWCRHVSPAIGEQPLLVGIADRDGRPLAMLPLGTVRRRGAATAHWLGGTHGNFNLGVLHHGAPARLGPAVLRALLVTAGRQAGVDAFFLTRMPYRWNGLPNPLARLGGIASVERGYRGLLGPDAEAVLQARLSSGTRRNLTRKERRLARHGDIRLVRADTPALAQRLLDAYLADKAPWFRARGIVNPFAAPGVHDFLADATQRGLAGGRPPIELYGYEVGGEILAVLGGAVADGRFCSMFIGMTDGELARFSPGQQLAVAVVADLCARGFQMFDLGVGDTAYKLRLCPDEEPLFDLALPVSLRGRALAQGWLARRHAMRLAKRSPLVRSVVDRVRRVRAQAADDDER